MGMSDKILKIKFTGSGDIVEGTALEVIQGFSRWAEGSLEEYMSDFAERFKIAYGRDMESNDAMSFLEELEDVGFLKFLVEKPQKKAIFTVIKGGKA